MNVLMLEDDDLVADLMETVVAGAYPGTYVDKVATLAQAQQRFRKQTYGLIIADWNLPDGSGLALVREARQKDAELPILMVSARSDRESVLQAAHYGINGYITKPFDVSTLHRRLAALLDVKPSEEHEDLEAVLASSQEQMIQLPSDLNADEVMALMARASELTPAQLAERWRERPGLVARLMDVANSRSFRRTGKPAESLKDALSLLGVGMALNQALAMALDVSREIQVPELATLAAGFQEQSVKVGREAQRLAVLLRHPPQAFQKAGLLSRVGELAVLNVLNQYVQRGGTLEEGDALLCLRRWAQPFGNRLKVQWRLPLGLREMIGAVHVLAGENIREERLIMRAAALVSDGRRDTDECRRLLARLGLDGVDTASESGEKADTDAGGGKDHD